MHLDHNKIDVCLQRITGDEKWFVYKNVIGKRSWSKPHEKLYCIKKGTWFQFCGIMKASCILKCFQKTKRSIQMFIINL